MFLLEDTFFFLRSVAGFHSSPVTRSLFEIVRRRKDGYNIEASRQTLNKVTDLILQITEYLFYLFLRGGAVR